MASHSERPTIDLAAGRVVLEADLPRVLASLGVEALEELGWRRPDGRTLLVPISGELGGQQEEYLLSLCFLTGRDWPPSAQFVNPETLDYVIPDDFHHLPIVETPELQVHTKYQSQHGKTLQLICSSATFEYYDVLHNGDDRILWQAKDTFFHTIAAIRRGMGSGYKGRQARHAE